LPVAASPCGGGMSARCFGATWWCGAVLRQAGGSAADGEGCRCRRWAAPVLSARGTRPATGRRLAGRLRLTGTEGLDVSEDRDEEQDAHRRHDDARIVDDGADAEEDRQADHRRTQQRDPLEGVVESPQSEAR